MTNFYIVSLLKFSKKHFKYFFIKINIFYLYILHMLYERSTDFEEGDSIFSKYACLDFIGAEKTRDFPIKPRLVQSHFYYEFAPWNDETKYIFVG